MNRRATYEHNFKDLRLPLLWAPVTMRGKKVDPSLTAKVSKPFYIWNTFSKKGMSQREAGEKKADALILGLID